MKEKINLGANVKADCSFDKLVDPDKLKPHPKNNNRHPVEQINLLAKNIEKFGFWRYPIVVSNQSGFIISGHGRLDVAKKLGLEKVPVNYQDFESDMHEYQQLTMDNEIARWSQLDRHMTHIELDEFPELTAEDLGIENWDFEPDVEVIEGEDEVPEVDDGPSVTMKGDIWLLGDHRVMCGDSTKDDNVLKLIDKNKIDAIYTDPPYGINEKGDRSNRGGITKGNKLKDFIDDSINYAVDAFEICESLNIPIQVWWGANYYCHHLEQSNNWIIWDKRLEDKQRDNNSDAELAWVKSKTSSCRIFRHLWKGLIKGSEHGQKRVHPTQKPVQLAVDIFDYYKINGNIMDLFTGSGSTLIACEKTNNKFFGMEFSEHYCDVIIKRWQELTKKEAINAKTGEKFNDILKKLEK